MIRGVLRHDVGSVITGGRGAWRCGVIRLSRRIQACKIGAHGLIGSGDYWVGNAQELIGILSQEALHKECRIVVVVLEIVLALCRF